MEQHRAADSVIRRVLGGWVAVLTRPTVATFTTLISGASWSGALLSLVIGSVPAGLARAATGGPDVGPVAAFIAGMVTNWVLFCIVAAYLLIVTRLLSNPPGQQAQVYALALFWPLLLVPLNLLGGEGILGVIGALLWLPATLYALFLTYRVVQAVPGLSQRSARFVVMVPVILLGLVGLLICGLLTLLSGNLNTIQNQ